MSSWNELGQIPSSVLFLTNIRADHTRLPYREATPSPGHAGPTASQVVEQRPLTLTSALLCLLHPQADAQRLACPPHHGRWDPLLGGLKLSVQCDCESCALVPGQAHVSLGTQGGQMELGHGHSSMIGRVTAPSCPNCKQRQSSALA